MTERLADKGCVPCQGGEPPLTRDQIEPLLAQLDGWAVQDQQRLVREYRFHNFAEAAEFVQQAARIAEDEWHHPELTLRWGLVQAVLRTNKIKGLSEADFVLAAKYDRLYQAGKRLVDNV